MTQKTKFYLSAFKLPPPVILVNVMETENYRLDAHRHEFYHVNHVTSGGLTVTLGGVRHEIMSGQTFILPPGVDHTLESPGGYTQIGIDVAECPEESESAMKSLSQALSALVGRRFALVDAPGGELEYERMKGLLSSLSSLNLCRVVAIAEGMVLDALERLECDGGDFASEFARLCGDEPWRLTLAEMCRKMGLSRAGLERKASRAFGCGASEYAARLRFSRLCTLLRTTSLTLDELARRLGFGDAAHLSVFFRARGECTPGEYRRK